MAEKYILITGAPGSQWSGIAKSICISPDINNSDRSKDREYSNVGKEFRLLPDEIRNLNSVQHFGSYFDPGMEFNNHKMYWDKPFTEDGKVKLIKSHTFANVLHSLDEYPIVMVLRDDDECLAWWHYAGGWDITYPNYDWYENDKVMLEKIKEQNRDIRSFIGYHEGFNEHNINRVYNNIELGKRLGLDMTDLPLHHYEPVVIVFSPPEP